MSNCVTNLVDFPIGLGYLALVDSSAKCGSIDRTVGGVTIACVKMAHPLLLMAGFEPYNCPPDKQCHYAISLLLKFYSPRILSSQGWIG